ISITKTYLCPHGEDSTCDCRKPKPKMLLDAAQEFGIDLSQSYMVGDRMSDVMAGKNAGVRTILVTRYQIPENAEMADFLADSLNSAIDFIAENP
ncbi:MAG: HAD-IIIA family hydrolase, partial [Candidatus Saccharimonadales bacterium]